MEFNPTELVYGSLLHKHRDAAVAGDEALRIRISDAITLFEELWPVETKRWTDAFSSKMG